MVAYRPRKALERRRAPARKGRTPRGITSLARTRQQAHQWRTADQARANIPVRVDSITTLASTIPIMPDRRRLHRIFLISRRHLHTDLSPRIRHSSPTIRHHHILVNIPCPAPMDQLQPSICLRSQRVIYPPPLTVSKDRQGLIAGAAQAVRTLRSIRHTDLITLCLTTRTVQPTTITPPRRMVVALVITAKARVRDRLRATARLSTIRSEVHPQVQVRFCHPFRKEDGARRRTRKPTSRTRTTAGRLRLCICLAMEGVGQEADVVDAITCFLGMCATISVPSGFPVFLG